MKHFLFIFGIVLFFAGGVMAADLPAFADGNELPASDLNALVNARTGDLRPINSSSLVYETATWNLGSTTYRWKDLYLSSSANIWGRLVVSTNVLFADPTVGKVGVGTTLPTTPLMVIGSANISSNLIVDTSSLFVDATNDRVGLGTTLPGARLNVNGAAAIGASYIASASTGNGLVVQGGVGIGTSAPNHPLHLYAGSDSSNNIDGVRLHNNGENGVNINFTNGNGNLGRIAVSKKGSGASSDEGVILFSTATNAVLSEKMRIDDAGFVGIGLLQAGPGGIGTVVYRQSGTAFRPQIVHTTTSTVSMIGTGVNDGTNNRRAGLFVNDTDGTIGIGMGYSSGAPAFVIMNDANEQFRITSAGNVGIGTTTAASRLTVSANASVGVGYIGTAAPTNGLIVQGNVGIGTTSPGRALDVIGSVKGTYFYTGARFNDVTSGTMLFQNGSILNGLIREVTGNVWALGHATSEVGGITNDLVWNSSGAVGIGTTSPATTLHSAGSLTVDGQTVFRTTGDLDTTGVLYTAFQDNSTGSYVERGWVGYGIGDASFGINNTIAAPITLRISGAEKMRITAGGAVGIGTTTPTKPLTVIGDISGSTGITVVTANVSGTLTAGTFQTTNLDIPGTANVTYLSVTGNPICEAYNSASISIPDATTTTLNWDSEYVDNGGLHSTVSNTSRMTITKSGWYFVNVYITWAHNATGYRRITLYKNGSLNGGESTTLPVIAGQYNTQSINVIRYYSVGDYVEVKAYQNSGGNLNLNSGGASVNESYFGIYLLPGPV
jgi:hypothetical protein